MGGKGNSSQPIIQDDSANMQYMGEMMTMMDVYTSQMGELMLAQNELLQTQQTSLPTVYENPDIDWSEKDAQLKAKAKADYDLDQLRRKNRTDTIHSSPLLDDEEPTTTSLLLQGQ